MEIIQDNILKDKRNALLSTIGFLKALEKNLSKDLAYKIAVQAAANFMIMHYENILKGTEPGKQERFDAFRRYYENYPSISPYCEVIESKPNYLKVNFHRCPVAEILYQENLFHFASAFCKSDKAFTDALLPGVKFNRNSDIVKGDIACIMSWLKV